MGASSVHSLAALSPTRNGRFGTAPLAVARRVAHETTPSLLLTVVMLCLIFGGCCSNVTPVDCSYRRVWS